MLFRSGIRPDGNEIEIHPECAEQTDELNPDQLNSDITHNTELDPEKMLLFSIDCLEEEELYPAQSAESLYSDGYVQKINVISSDDEIGEVVDGGDIQSSYSFGTTKITTGQKTGPLTISTSVNGVGTGSFSTEVVNSLEQKEVRIFSPTGDDSLIFDRDGYFDVFLVALDGSERPKKIGRAHV